MPYDVAVAPAAAVPDHHVVLDGLLVLGEEGRELLRVAIGGKDQAQEDYQDISLSHHAADDATVAYRNGSHRL